MPKPIRHTRTNLSYTTKCSSSFLDPDEMHSAAYERVYYLAIMQSQDRVAWASPQKAWYVSGVLAKVVNYPPFEHSQRLLWAPALPDTVYRGVHFSNTCNHSQHEGLVRSFTSTSSGRRCRILRRLQCRFLSSLSVITRLYTLIYNSIRAVP